MSLELRQYSDLSYRSTKLYLLFESLKKRQHFKAETLFHSGSNLLCLVCRRVFSFLFAPRCIFYCVRTWCVVWERHGLSDIATVTKEGGFLQRVNCEIQAQWRVVRCKLIILIKKKAQSLFRLKQKTELQDVNSEFWEKKSELWDSGEKSQNSDFWSRISDFCLWIWSLHLDFFFFFINFQLRVKKSE